MSKPKVLISTDIGGGDKDDAQSLIHALLYADAVDYKGFVATMTNDSGDSFGTMRKVFDAYDRDLSNLRKASGDYPAGSELRDLMEQGASNPSWPGPVSAGARKIIDEARDASPDDPLYVLTWGPIHDAARALREAPDIVSNVRLISIAGYGQDKSHPEAYRWLKDAVAQNDDYSELWWVNSEETFRGMYVGSDGQNDPGRNLDWVKENADGHGALGNLFHDSFAYDLYGRMDGDESVNGLKMGDTPSLLYLLDTANNDDPGARSWGGSFSRNGLGPNTWDDKDESAFRLGSYDGAKTVQEHRSKAWGDFAARLDRADGAGSGAPAPEPAPEPKPEPAPAPETGDGGGDGGGDGTGIGLGRSEVEALELDGYGRESRAASSDGANVQTFGSGSAAGAFTGPDGTYRVTVGYINEDDGVAAWRLLVDGREVEAWSGTGGRNAGEEITVKAALETGDRIELQGRAEGYSQARLDWIEIASAGSGAPAPAPEPAPEPKPEPAPAPETGTGDGDGGGDGTGIGLGRSEVEALELDGYGRESRAASSDGANVQTFGSGSAAGAFTGPDGTYRVTVGYINEDDGVAAWRLLVDGREVEAWSGIGGRNAGEEITVNAALETGDRIELQGRAEGYSQARLDWIEIASAGSGAPAPAPQPQPDDNDNDDGAGSGGGSTGGGSGGQTGIGLGLTEVERLDLDGFSSDARSASSGGGNVSTMDRGTASGTFTGADGDYTLTVGYINEFDGVSSYRLLVNGREEGSWTGAGGRDASETETLTVALETGDRIELEGARGGWEYARLDWLRIAEADGGAPAPAPKPEPQSPALPSEIDTDLFVFAGQSNANGHFFRRGGDGSGGSLGNDVFEDAIEDRFGGSTSAVNASTSGSGSNQYADGTQYWWDVDRDRPGPELEKAMRQIRSAESSGRDVDGLIWAQGEDDARAVRDDRGNLASTVSRFEDATRSVFDYIRAELDDPDLPIFIQQLGDFPQDGGWLDGPDGALDAMRAAQARIVSEMDDVYLGARTTDISQHHDTIHFNNAGYGAIAERLADTVSDVVSSDWIA